MRITLFLDQLLLTIQFTKGNKATKSPFNEEIVIILTFDPQQNVEPRGTNTSNVTSLPKYGVLLVRSVAFQIWGITYTQIWKTKVSYAEVEFFLPIFMRIYDLPTRRLASGLGCLVGNYRFSIRANSRLGLG